MRPEGLTIQPSNAILTVVRDDLLASCKLGVRVNVGSFLFYCEFILEFVYNICGRI